MYSIVIKTGQWKIQNSTEKCQELHHKRCDVKRSERGNLWELATRGVTVHAMCLSTNTSSSKWPCGEHIHTQLWPLVRVSLYSSGSETEKDYDNLFIMHLYVNEFINMFFLLYYIQCMTVIIQKHNTRVVWMLLGLISHVNIGGCCSSRHLWLQTQVNRDPHSKKPSRK